MLKPSSCASMQRSCCHELPKDVPWPPFRPSWRSFIYKNRMIETLLWAAYLPVGAPFDLHFGPFWLHLGPACAPLEASWSHLVSILRSLEPSWAPGPHLGTILGLLGLSCSHLDAILRLIAADWLSFDANLSHIESISALLASIFR